MKLGARGAILALLITSACGVNSTPAPKASHPQAVDLNCPGEPDIAALLAADPSGLAFDAAVRTAGQVCRDALARVCRWHKRRGAAVNCPAALPGEVER